MSGMGVRDSLDAETFSRGKACLLLSPEKRIIPNRKVNLMHSQEKKKKDNLVLYVTF